MSTKTLKFMELLKSSCANRATIDSSDFRSTEIFSYSEKGSSLVGVMVAIGILGILAVIFSAMMSNTIQVSKMVERKSEQEDLRRYIRIAMSCSKTLASVPVPCPAETLVDIRKIDNTVLIAAASGNSRLKIGEYYVQAFCTGMPREFNFRSSLKQQEAGDLMFKIPYPCP